MVTVGVPGTVVGVHLSSKQLVIVIIFVDSNVSVSVGPADEDDPSSMSTTLKTAELTKVPSFSFNDSAKSDASSSLDDINLVHHSLSDSFSRVRRWRIFGVHSVYWGTIGTIDLVSRNLNFSTCI